MELPRTGLCVVSGLLALFAGAAGAAVGDDPDPLEVLRRADQALSEVKSFTATVRSEGVGANATLSPDLEARIGARRSADEGGWLFEVEGHIRPAGGGEREAFHVAFDGTTGRRIDEANKLVYESGAGGLGELVGPGPGRAMDWLSMWSTVVAEPLADGGDSLMVEYVGKAEVGGVSCDVVRQDTSDFTELEEYVLWWFVGVDDHLPRRLDSFYLETEKGTNGVEVVKITDLRAGAEVSEASLSLAVPEGFEVRQVQGDKAPSRAQGGQRAAPPTLVGKPAPAWTLKDPAGVSHSLADYRGKVVLIDFWATWCGWCKIGMPAIQKLHEKYLGKDVAVLGITVWEAGDPVKYMKDNGFAYTLLLGDDELPGAYGIQGIPRLVVVGKDGTVVHDATGYDEQAEANLGAVIDKALEAR